MKKMTDKEAAELLAKGNTLIIGCPDYRGYDHRMTLNANKSDMAIQAVQEASQSFDETFGSHAWFLPLLN